MFQFKNNAGLSLIEVMIVVAIVGILSALAIPRFRAFKSRAYRAEAYTSLYKIHTLQGTYHGDNDTYTALPDVGYTVKNGSNNPITECNVGNVLGFNLTDCTKAKYRYNTSGTHSEFAFLAFAVAKPLGGGTENLVYPGCSMFDEISINHGRATEMITDSITLCHS